MAFRVLIAGLFHETHTFLNGRTSIAAFQIQDADRMLAATGDSSPLGGVLEFARDARWVVIPAVDMRAMPGPLVEDRAVERFWRHLHESLAAAERLDGVLLVLHGAMVAESFDDVEGEILRRLWRLCGDGATPICAVLDLHANLSADMVRCSHGLVAYRQNPHADAREAAIDAARLLDRLLRSGERAVNVWQQTSIMWPPTGTGTADEPMKSLEAAARDIERRNQSVLATNVLAGFAFADTPHTGVSFSATTIGDPARARAELAQLGALAAQNRELGNRLDPPPAAVVAEIRCQPAGPIVVAEPADNIGAGASGAGTGLLRVFLEHAIENAIVIINDPTAVQAVNGIAPGQSVVVPIGRKDTVFDPDPLELEVALVSTSDGRFDLEDPRSHLASMFGSRIEMGPCAVVWHEGILILLTSRRTPPFDLGQLRSQGIEPAEASVIAVKAAVAHRRAYDRIARANYTVATPGPCSSDLRTFFYRKVRQPMYPLDR